MSDQMRILPWATSCPIYALVEKMPWALAWAQPQKARGPWTLAPGPRPQGRICTSALQALVDRKFVRDVATLVPSLGPDSLTRTMVDHPFGPGFSVWSPLAPTFQHDPTSPHFWTGSSAFRAGPRSSRLWGQSCTEARNATNHISVEMVDPLFKEAQGGRAT